MIAGWGEACEFVDERPILDMMSRTPRKARRAYRRFVEAGLAETDEEFLDLLRKSKWGIGEGAFQDRIRELHTDRVGEMRRTEDASFRRESPAVSASVVLDAVAGEFGIQAAFLRKRRYDCVGCAVAVLLPGRDAGMNQRDAAAFLGMGTGSAACRQLKRLQARLADDRSPAQRAKRISRTLDGRRDTRVIAAMPMIKVFSDPKRPQQAPNPLSSCRRPKNETADG
jgi:hypothetical protein